MITNTLGLLMWRGVQRKLGDGGIIKHGVKDLADNLQLTEKTVLRRLKGEKPWLYSELVDYQAAYDNDDVQYFIDGAFKTARNNGRKENHHERGALSALRTDEQNKSGPPDERVLQTLRQMLDDHIRKDHRSGRHAG